MQHKTLPTQCNKMLRLRQRVLRWCLPQIILIPTQMRRKNMECPTQMHPFFPKCQDELLDLSLVHNMVRPSLVLSQRKPSLVLFQHKPLQMTPIYLEYWIHRHHVLRSLQKLISCSNHCDRTHTSRFVWVKTTTLVGMRKW